MYYHSQKIREIGDASEKNDISPTMPLYFHPSPFNIRALPPYKIYVFRMSKTCATFKWKEIYKFAWIKDFIMNKISFQLKLPFRS